MFSAIESPDVRKAPNTDGEEGRKSVHSLTQGVAAVAHSSSNLLEHKTNAGGLGFDRASFNSIIKDNKDHSVTNNPIFAGAHTHEGPQHDLTWRSLIVGAILGVLFGTQNIYFGFRSGVSFGGSITVSLLGFAIMRGLTKVIGARLPFTVHENVILQTTAATGQSMIFSGGFSTYILAMSEQVAKVSLAEDEFYDVTYVKGLVWLLAIICLGFFMAQPMRKQLIVKNNYPWPTPTATAVVIKSLHGAGAGDLAMKMLVYLLKVILASYLWYFFKWMYNANGSMESWPVFGAAAAKYSWTLDWSTAYIGSGVLMPFKSAWSMLLGTIVMFGIIAPSVATHIDPEGNDWITDPKLGSFKGVKSYWFLSSLCITVVDSIYQIAKIAAEYIHFHRTSKNAAPEEQSEIDLAIARDEADPKRNIPAWFWGSGFVINGIILCVVAPLLFDVKWYMCLVCLLIGPVIGYGINLGAALTDVALVSALGKFIIICMGNWAGNITKVLWLAGVGMASVGSSNDLLGDYRTAYLIGTSTRSMFIAQIFGALVATFFTPLMYNVFKDALTITETGNFTAPGAVSLRALAVLFTEGFSILPKNVGWFVLGAGIWTIVNNVLLDYLPEKYSRFLPNSIAFAVGGYVAPSFGINPVIGFAIKSWWMYANPTNAEIYSPALGGGMIAGEGLAATTSALLMIAGVKQPEGMQISFGPVSSE